VVLLRAGAFRRQFPGPAVIGRASRAGASGRHTAVVREDVDSSEGSGFDRRDSERPGYNRAGSTLACGRFGAVLLEGVVPAAGASSESSSIRVEERIGIIAL
jgi:hypothetical protein